MVRRSLPSDRGQPLLGDLERLARAAREVQARRRGWRRRWPAPAGRSSSRAAAIASRSTPAPSSTSPSAISDTPIASRARAARGVVADGVGHRGAASRATPQGLAVAALEHPHLRPPARAAPRAPRSARSPGSSSRRAARGLQRRVVAGERPLDARQAAPGRRRRGGASRSGSSSCSAASQQASARGAVVGQEVRVGGLARAARRGRSPASASASGTCAEQLERALEQRGGLAVGVHALGGVGRGDARAQRGGPVARAEAVQGDGRAEQVPGAGALGRARRSSASAIRPCSSARSPGSRSSATTSRCSAWRKAYVPSAPATTRCAATASRSASRSARGVEAAGLLQQLVVRALGRRPAGAAPPARPRTARSKRTMSASRSVAGSAAAAVGAGGQQLLHVQRVALAARPQAAHELGPGGAPRISSTAASARRRPAASSSTRGTLRQLGQQRAQRMAAVQLVRAVAGHGQHALGAQAAAPGTPGSARVERSAQCTSSSDEQHRPAGAEGVEQVEHRLEEVRLGGGVLRRRERAGRPSPPAGRAAAGPAPRARPARSASNTSSPSRTSGRSALTQRRVGQLAVAQLDAVAAQHAARRPRALRRTARAAAASSPRRIRRPAARARAARRRRRRAPRAARRAPRRGPTSRSLVTRAAMTPVWRRWPRGDRARHVRPPRGGPAPSDGARGGRRRGASQALARGPAAARRRPRCGANGSADDAAVVQRERRRPAGRRRARAGRPRSAPAASPASARRTTAPWSSVAHGPQRDRRLGGGDRDGPRRAAGERARGRGGCEGRSA